MGIREGKEIFIPLNVIRKPELWNAHDGVRGVYLRASNIFTIRELSYRMGLIGSFRYSQRKDFWPEMF